MLSESIVALNALGAVSQGEILKSAIDKLSSKLRKKLETVEEYVERALEGEFDELDGTYYNSSPSVSDLLEKYLEKKREHFVIIM